MYDVDIISVLLHRRCKWMASFALMPSGRKAVHGTLRIEDLGRRMSFFTFNPKKTFSTQTRTDARTDPLLHNPETSILKDLLPCRRREPEPFFLTLSGSLRRRRLARPARSRSCGPRRWLQPGGPGHRGIGARRAGAGSFENGVIP